jgi:hypothetical protein
MRLSSAVLVGGTCSLAIACGYLAMRLHDEREQVRASADRIHELNAQVAALKELRVTAPGESATVVQVTPASAPTRKVVSPPPASSRGKITTEQARALQEKEKKRYADPAVRALMIAREKIDVRRQNPGIAKELGLTAEQEDALLELLASQAVDREAAPLGSNALRRDATEDDRRAYQVEYEALVHAQEDAVAAHLGYKYQQYLSYQRSGPERRQVSALRARLDGANALSDVQATRLVAAMYEERERYAQQILEQAQRTGHTVVYSPEYPPRVVVLTQGEVDPLKSAAEQVDRARTFMNLVRARVSAVLTPEQLRRFDEINEELLIAEQVRADWASREAGSNAGH